MIDVSRSFTMKLLNQWDIRDGVCITKERNLVWGVSFTLPSISLNADEAADELHDGWMMVLRTIIPYGQFIRLYVETLPPEDTLIDGYLREGGKGPAVVQNMRRERYKQFYEMRKGRKLVIYKATALVNLTPPKKGFMSAMFNSLVGWRGNYDPFTPEELAAKLKRCHAMRARLHKALDGMGLQPSLLDQQKLFELMWRYYNPKEKTHQPPIYESTNPSVPRAELVDHPEDADPTLRTALTRSSLERRNEHLELGGHYIGMVSLTGAKGQESYTGMINQLLAQKSTYWLVIDLKRNPRANELRDFEAQADKYNNSMNDTTFTNRPSSSTRVGSANIEEALDHAQKRGSEIYSVGFSFVLVEESEEALEEGRQQLQGTLNKLPGLHYTYESDALLEQFKHLAPGTGLMHDRPFKLFEENAGDLLPGNAPWPGYGKPVSLFVNKFDGLTKLDWFDPKNPNWNFFIVGKSGRGKTVLMQTLLADLIDQGVEVTIVQRGGSYQHFVEVIGGEYKVISPEESYNVFELEEGQVEPDIRKTTLIMRVVKSLLLQGGITPSPVHTAILMAAIRIVYESSREDYLDELGVVRAHLKPVYLRDYVKRLYSMEIMDGERMSDDEIKEARTLASYLKGYTGDTIFGRFLDRDSTISLDNPVTFFNIEGISEVAELEPITNLLIGELTWRRKRLEPNKRRMVIFDELWFLQRYDSAMEMLDEFVRVARENGFSVGAITNKYDDLNHPKMSSIIQNTTYQVFLGNPGSLDKIQADFELPDATIEQLRGLRMVKGDYSEFLFVVQNGDSIRGEALRNKLNPYQLWLVSSDPNDRRIRERYEEEHGSFEAAIAHLVQDYPNGASSEDRI